MQEEILRDCQQMVPDTSRRLAAAISDLESCMVRGLLSLRVFRTESHPA